MSLTDLTKAKVGQQLLIAGSQLSLEDWNEAHSLRDKKKCTCSGICINCQPEWYFQARCSDCVSEDRPNAPHLRGCTHDPLRTKTAEEFMALHVAAIKEAKVLEGTPSGRKRRGSVRVELPEEEYQVALDRFDAGEGVVVIAEALNVRPPWLSQFLRDQGRTIKKGGGGKGLAAAREARKAAKAMVLEAGLGELEKVAVAAKYKAYTPIKKLAEEYRVPANLIKSALIEQGVRLRSQAEAMAVARDQKGGKGGRSSTPPKRKSHPVRKVQPNKKSGRRK